MRTQQCDSERCAARGIHAGDEWHPALPELSSRSYPLCLACGVSTCVSGGDENRSKCSSARGAERASAMAAAAFAAADFGDTAALGWRGGWCAASAASACAADAAAVSAGMLSSVSAAGAATVAAAALIRACWCARGFDAAEWLECGTANTT